MFEKKTVYHSELVKESPVTVEMTSDVLESKFKKGTYYVCFKHDGNEHQLTLENQACEDALRDLKGQFATITATGSRDNAALDVVMAESPQGHQKPAPRQSAPSAQSGRAPVRATSTAGTDDLAGLARFKRKLMQKCVGLATIRRAVEAFEQNTGELTPAERQAITSTLFIACDRDGGFDSLPAAYQKGTGAALPPARSKPAAPLPQFDQESAEDDDIPY